MKAHTLKYLFKEGIIGLWKNRLMAVASILTIVLCLLILGSSYAIIENIQYVLEQIESEIGITAYIEEGTTSDRIERIEQQIEANPYIVEVDFISKEDALRNFSTNQGNSELFEEFIEDNPLPASFELKIDDLNNQTQVIQELQSISELEVAYFEKEAMLFIKLDHILQMVSFFIVGSLIGVALLLISNTIKLTVYIRKKEINIMKYIGATDAFIRLPFLIEGFLIGAIGTLIPIFILNKVYTWGYELSQSSLKNILGTLEFYSPDIIIGQIIPVYIVIGIGLGAIGSGIAIRKHLRV